MQRFFDIVFSALALIGVAPLLLPIVVILRFTGECEVFYKQQRVGIRGEYFYLLKFATMLKESPHIGAGEITVKHDPRVLPFGRILRKTKLNELPQLINILVGDLSIVGPRPMVPNTFADYPERAQETLTTVRPGLTGVGSVIFRDEERFLDERDDPRRFYKEAIIPYKAKLEEWYIQHQSLQIYFEAIFLTAWVIVFPNSQLPWRLWADLPRPPAEIGNI